MLSTIVMTLLGIWLALMIIGWIIGGVFSYKMWRSILSDDKSSK